MEKRRCFLWHGQQMLIRAYETKHVDLNTVTGEEWD